MDENDDEDDVDGENNDVLIVVVVVVVVVSEDWAGFWAGDVDCWAVFRAEEEEEEEGDEMAIGVGFVCCGIQSQFLGLAVGFTAFQVLRDEFTSSRQWPSGLWFSKLVSRVHRRVYYIPSPSGGVSPSVSGLLWYSESVSLAHHRVYDVLRV
ncbi:hypothetical protein Pmani_032846 [Petrolisthes manimaculis]|uniref:Uncharacterized protein n=1 Tax=Petrolisthes manimaculis TaxID=1843537 RepID=A0AAE1NT21_9EUCA|nr:hypothetical protein Pmani_032846 [Petrolisthes manimaculis]